jgi:nucleoside-diphosphate-sugar epimerase
MTGATGTLGSWMAARALREGTGVCAIARGGRAGSAAQRVRSSLATFESLPLDGLRVLEGDVTSDESWSDGESRIPRDVNLVVHCAACTDFCDGAAEVSHRTNVEGVARVLAFAARRRLPVVHVSTAYVAGRREGLVLEDELDLGQSFNNVYERTKCAGEALVHRWSRETGLRAIILRPGIVVGDFERGRTRRFNTLYDIMQALDSLGAAVRGEALRVVGDERVTKNIIPIDFFADVAWQIVRARVPGTYHITHPSPLSMGDLRRTFVELFEIQAELVSEAEFTARRPSRAERVCHRAIQSYRPYVTRAEPVFDRTHVEAIVAGAGIVAPALDTAFFRRLLAYAKGVNWGRDRTVERTAPIAEYFDAFLTAKLGQPLLPDVRRLSARIAVGFHGTDAHWSLHVEDGALRTISNNGMTTDCRYLLDVPTFLEIVGGRLNPQQAFFSRRVEISGNVETGLRVAAVLGQFFRKHPFESDKG